MVVTCNLTHLILFQAIVSILILCVLRIKFIRNQMPFSLIQDQLVVLSWGSFRAVVRHLDKPVVFDTSFVCLIVLLIELPDIIE